ncbi:MAG: mannosyltransferase family protein [Crocosphaera sp.]|nr:mannosyltransferase family protein [Crocosphaera sp.]
MIRLANKILDNQWFFIVLMGLLSRGVIILTMVWIAPLLSISSGSNTIDFGWEVFSAWDSDLYQKIATNSYDKLGSEPGANVAFFPLFPLLIRLGMSLGFSSNIVGFFINNAAFFLTLFIVYVWVKNNNSSSAARWVVAILAWCPSSIFGTVIYTEGLFLLLSSLALFTFENKQYTQTILWGILATATRITGLALVPTFLFIAWRKKLSIMAYVAALGSSGGILLYSLYCWFQFNDPIAFITVQYTQWQRKQGIDWEGWGRMLAEITIGGKNWAAGTINDPWHPLLFLLIISLAYGLWHYRKSIPKPYFDYSLGSLCLLLWLLSGDALLNTLSVLGGLLLLWCCRQHLAHVAYVYGLCALGLLLSSGGTISLNRLAYGIVSLSIALGLTLSQSPRWGYLTLGFFGLLLVTFSLRFAQHQWVAILP